jgi:hypothetical protein
MQIDEKQTLEEILGTFIRQTPTPPPGYVSGNAPRDTRPETDDLIIRGITTRNCRTLESWQSEIVRLISDQNRDQYVIARPGGGKTLPIICHWTNNLLGLDTMMNTNLATNFNNIRANLQRLFSPKATNVPKVLMMVPVISLAQQTAAELRRDLANIMLQYYNSNPADVIQILINTNSSSQDPDIRREIGSIQRIYNERDQIRTELTGIRNNITTAQDTLRTNPNDITARNTLNVMNERNRNLEERLTTINSNLIGGISNIIADLVNRKIFVRTGDFRQNTEPLEAYVYVTIYESAKELLKLINLRDLRLIVIDESHLAQGSGLEYEDQSRSYQIAGSMYNDVLGDRRIRNNRDCRLVFLTGTVNPDSAASMIQYLNKNYDRNFAGRPIVAPQSAANRTPLTIVRNESIRTEEGILASIMRAVHQNDWGQLYVIFSSKRIGGLIRMCIEKIGVRNIEATSPYGYQSQDSFSGLGKDRSRVGSIKLDSIDKLSIPPGKEMLVANITSPILRQTVLRGVGFLHRNVPGNVFADGGEKELRMSDQDKLIVADLFRKRKINVLLATDAVGIGVNIDVKDLYIPSLTKFNNQIKKNIEVSLRDLSQILNRAGRGATPVASIQTPGENIEFVTKALSASPEDFPEVDAYSTTSAQLNRTRRLPFDRSRRIF